MNLKNFALRMSVATALMGPAAFAFAAPHPDTAPIEVAGNTTVVVVVADLNDPSVKVRNGQNIRAEADVGTGDLVPALAGTEPRPDLMPPIATIRAPGRVIPLPHEAKWRPDRPYPGDYDVAGGWWGFQGQKKRV